MDNKPDEIHQLIQQVSRLATQMEMVSPVLENQMKGLTDMNNIQIKMGEQVSTNIGEISSIRREIKELEIDSDKRINIACEKLEKKQEDWFEKHEKVHADNITTTRWIVNTGIAFFVFAMGVIVFMMDRLYNR